MDMDGPRDQMIQYKGKCEGNSIVQTFLLCRKNVTLVIIMVLKGLDFLE